MGQLGRRVWVCVVYVRHKPVAPATRSGLGLFAMRTQERFDQVRFMRCWTIETVIKRNSFVVDG